MAVDSEVARLQARNVALETEVKQLSARLAQDAPTSAREALLVEAEQAAHLGSWMWDLATEQVYWSDELFRILGKNPAVDRASPDAFFGSIHAEDIAHVRQATERSLATKRAERIDFRVVQPGGQVREIVMDGSFILDEQGAISRMVGGCLDVTERRRSERDALRSRVLLEMTEQLAGVGVFYWEQTTQSTWWSPEMYGIFKTDRALTNDAFLARVLPEDLPSMEAMQRQVRAHGSAGPVAFRIRWPSGELRHLLMSARVIGHLGAIGGSVVDITDRIRLEERLRRSQKLEALGRLAGGIAHDFNNLLTVIIGNLDLVLSDGPDQRLLAEALLASQQGVAMTRQLLSFSRDAVIERRPLELSDLVERALSLLRRVLGDDIEVRLNIGAGKWNILGDASQINQVLMNLAVNARDALPGGGALTISLGHARLDDVRRPTGATSDRFVALTVKDNGSGMDEATRSRVFEPFFSTKAPGAGTGLGMATVFGIVTQHGGNIEIDSTPGRGTEVRIYLPEGDEPGASVMAAPDTRRSLVLPEVILLVEADRRVGRRVQRFLEADHHRVIPVGSATEAMAIADTSVGLVITDCELPDMSGLALAKQLRDRRAELKVLYIMGHAARWGALPDAPVIQKPFSREQFLAKVGAVLVG
jgi:PAS domain S-box-containing protein